MKITKVETILVKELPHIVWVHVYTDAGLVGLGETWYAPRSVAAVIHEVYAPTLIGKDPLAIELHWHNMFRLADSWGYGGAETRAISALDIALWDIAGQAMGQPIYNLLGGPCRDRVRIYNTCVTYGDIRDGHLGWEDPVALAKSLLDEGITAMKNGTNFFFPPGEHLAEPTMGHYLSSSDMDRALGPIRKIREALGDEIEIAHDGHADWNLPNAIRIAQAMEPYNMMWQEELLSTFNVDAHLRLAQGTKTPICVAERLVGRYQFREYIEKGAAEIVMPDLIWTGGISEVKKICTMASVHQAPVCPHDATGPVNVFACAHICMNVPNIMLMETARSYYKGWYGSFVDPNLRIEGGYLYAPEGPGLGTRLRPEVRERPDASVEVSDQPGEYDYSVSP